MKRILSIILALVLLCPLIAANAAIRGKMSLEGKILNPKKGESFSVTVKLEQNPGIVSLRATVSFDPKVLEIAQVEGIGPLPNFSFDQSEKDVLLRWKGSGQGQNITATGDLARITFRVVEKPIYGDSTIDLAVSQSLYDAQNSDGVSVPFDTTGLAFTLICPHEKTDRTIAVEPSFEEAGEAILTCKSCGETIPESILPSLESEDRSLLATLQPGEYTNDEQKSVTAEFLSEGEEQEAALTIFGDRLISVFRIAFTRDGAPFFPAGETELRLSFRDALPEEVALYLLLDGGPERIDFAREKDTLTFPYRDLAYILVERETEEPSIPEATTTTTTAAPTTTKDVREAQRRREIALILGGTAVFILCAVGGILLLNKRKKF